MSEHPRSAYEAERSILAACLSDARNAAEARFLLGAADFYLPAHQHVFAAICELDEARAVPDPTTVYTKLTDQGQLERAGGASYLHTLYAHPFVAANLDHYARQVVGTSRVRQLVAASMRVDQICHDVEDVEQIMALTAEQADELSLLAREPLTRIDSHRQSFTEMLATEDEEADWVIPDLLDRQDALMVIATEGAGKSWLLRQYAICTAAGLHPMRFPATIPAKRVAVVDAENSKGTLRRSLRSINQQATRLLGGDWDHDNLEIVSQPGGLNLRKPEHALRIEQVIRDHRPDLLVIGPLYKLAARGRDDWDTAAAEVRDLFDSWRDKYGCAFILEHHMPKGDGKDRPETPFGGSEWMRWVTQGRTLSALENGYYQLSNFRGGDREERDQPLGLRRGGELPWTPVWDSEELDYHRPATPSRRR